MSTRRCWVPLCQTSCSNESSNTTNLPSCHVRTSSATRKNTPSGTLRPRCARRRQFVGPQCGQMCTPGLSSENFTWPRLHVRAASIRSSSEHVRGTRAQFASFRLPRTNKANSFHSPFSRRFSSSDTNAFCFLLSWVNASDRIVSQLSSSS